MKHETNKPIENSKIELVEFEDNLAQHFYDINAQWISSMFVLEEIDKQVLQSPRSMIIDNGGVILFAKTKGQGIVGTCALMKADENSFELTKMGVLENVRGLKVGEILLDAILKRAKEMNIKKLFLLTNSKCEAAIHIYEKLGFEHSKEIMDEFGHEYERCDVAMLYTKK